MKILKILQDCVRDIWLEIKWSFQRKFRGYSQEDLWGLNEHLSKVILKRLRAFKKMERYGYPSGAYMQNIAIEDGDGMVLWNEILDKIIWSFQHVIHDFGMENGCPYHKEIWVPCKPYKTNDIFGTMDTKYNKEADDKFNKKYEEGMKLFAEYFHSLWD